MSLDPACIDQGGVFMPLFRHLEKSEEGSKLAVFELAQAIDASLSRVAQSHDGFTGAHARAAGHHVCVRYHHSQEPSYLSIDEARRYLDWIRAGHVGPHWDVKD
ncbi:hypothetical protein [Acidithiobacillus sp.]